MRGSGASCMLLPQISAKQGHGVSICWIQDSAALLLRTLLSPSACTLMLSLFPSRLLNAFLPFSVFLCLTLLFPLGGVHHKSQTCPHVIWLSLFLVCALIPTGACDHTSGGLVNKASSSIKPQPTSRSPCDDITPLAKREGVVSWSCWDFADVTKIRHVSQVTCRCFNDMQSPQKSKKLHKSDQQDARRGVPSDASTSGKHCGNSREVITRLEHISRLVLRVPLIQTGTANSTNQQNT